MTHFHGYPIVDGTERHPQHINWVASILEEGGPGAVVQYTRIDKRAVVNEHMPDMKTQMARIDRECPVERPRRLVGQIWRIPYPDGSAEGTITERHSLVDGSETFTGTLPELCHSPLPHNAELVYGPLAPWQDTCPYEKHPTYPNWYKADEYLGGTFKRDDGWKVYRASATSPTIIIYKTPQHDHIHSKFQTIEDEIARIEREFPMPTDNKKTLENP